MEYKEVQKAEMRRMMHSDQWKEGKRFEFSGVLQFPVSIENLAHLDSFRVDMKTLTEENLVMIRDKLEEPSLEIKSEHLEEIDESIEAPNTDIWSGMGPAVCVEQDKCDDHRCCLCGFFVRGGDGNRKSHVIARHSVAKHLKCKECDYRDKSKVPMRNHTISVHGRDITPEDITDDNMKAELMEIMAKCFPNIRPNKIKNISNCAACKLCDSRLKMPLVNRYEEVAELIKVVSASINFKRCSFELLEMPDVETLKGVLNLQQTGSPDVFSIPNSNLVIEFLPSDDKIQITKI
ncbi:hypothetical protein GCK72_020388 [Caenorhabditis remanei]|uniref:DUF38 domain-containing protein n=1 Tax=Caenorhabditis remanei TaxID=31234 RepID=A0A6A5GGV3_CAERE|nr:hypothetical protein GCK72_020388 [Caenorhabditis remanei]KAF1753831.1 hypothetical protein GCK72_020388 [Caenorhabditis remanei]